MDFENLSIEELSNLVASKRQFAQGIAEAESPTTAEVDQAVAAADEADSAQAEIDKRESEATASAESVASLRARFAAEDPEEGDEEDEVEEAEVEEVEEATEDEVEEAAVEPAPVVARSRVARIAKKVDRPKAPAKKDRVLITAAADVPDFGSGEDLGGIDRVAEALVSRLKAFGTPNGNGEGVDLRYAGVAKFALDFDADLVIERNSDDLAVIKRAGDESRLPKKSLTASGGWCTPSENLYDLCEGETLDGLVSLPEVQVRRGGINFTKGPDFSTLYNDPDMGFIQTEAEAEAGTPKPCFELSCPDWTDVRLDAVGLCIKVPILTNAAFPELTQRVVRGSMVAHQHKVNASVIDRMVTIAGAATDLIDYTSTANSLFVGIARVANIKRQAYKMGFDETMEAVLPYWVKDAIREDMALRGGRPIDAITDAYITNEFNIRKIQPQWVYDWQELDSDTITAGYPDAVDVLMYPAGTFVKGVSDVISLNAVYDAASLATNVYTGLFFEEGLLVANTCFDADLITLPVCISGRTGAQDLTLCGVDTTP